MMPCNGQGGSIQQDDCTLTQADFFFYWSIFGAFAMMDTTPLVPSLYLKKKKKQNTHAKQKDTNNSDSFKNKKKKNP